MEQERPGSAEPGKIKTAPANLKQESFDQEVRPFCLEVINPGRKKWELPWSAFYMATITEAKEAGKNGEEIDEIILYYVRCEVALKGLNLGHYRKGINEGTLREIQVVSEEYRKTEENKNHPVVVEAKLTVFGIK